jgi:hypothetical protein
MLGYRPIRAVLARQHREGYWGTERDIYAWWPRKDTTFWVLGVLADFGLSKDMPRLSAGAEYVFATQLPSGGFGWAPPPTPAECFTGILTEALAKLGYADDRRLAKAYQWLASRQRADGGFWCKNTGQPGGPREAEPSCAFATLCVAGACAQYAGLRGSQVARRATGFLLSCWQRRGKIKYAGHDSQIGKGWDKLKYPFTDYRMLKYLDVLSQFPWVRRDRRIGEVLDVLFSKPDPEGRFYAESIHKAWSDFDFAQKKAPSRWLTLLAHRAARRFC